MTSKVVEWVKVSASEKVPASAVQAQGSELYIGRHKVGNELVIGEVNLMTAEPKCIVVTRWKAHEFSEYEVLCARQVVASHQSERLTTAFPLPLPQPGMRLFEWVYDRRMPKF